MEKTKLNIGSGYRPYSKANNEWLDLDIRPDLNPDIVADARNIPLPKEPIQEILAHSVLEHFSKWQYKECLKEWYRVLEFGGKLVISVPDMAIVGTLLANSDLPITEIKNKINLVYGEQDYPENQHKWGWTFKTLDKDLKEIGFKTITRLQSKRYYSELLVEAIK